MGQNCAYCWERNSTKRETTPAGKQFSIKKNYIHQHPQRDLPKLKLCHLWLQFGTYQLKTVLENTTMKLLFLSRQNNGLQKKKETMTQWKAFVRTNENVLEPKWRNTEKDNSLIPHYSLGTIILRVDSDIVFVSTQKWAPKEQRDSDSVESLCENFVRTSESVLEPQWRNSGIDGSLIPHYFLGTMILRVDSDIVFVNTQEWVPKEQRDSDSVKSLCENVTN